LSSSVGGGDEEDDLVVVIVIGVIILDNMEGMRWSRCSRRRELQTGASEV
jgi:hypothetical protein